MKDCDLIDVEFSTQYFTRSTQAEAENCMAQIKRDRDWHVTGELKQVPWGWCFTARKAA